MLTFVRTCDARARYVSSWVGWGGVGDVKFLHIERKITSVDPWCPQRECGTLSSEEKLDHTLARKNDRPTWRGVFVVVW